MTQSSQNPLKCFLTRTRPRSKAWSYLFTSHTFRDTHTLYPNPRPVFMPPCLLCCDIYTAQYSSWCALITLLLVSLHFAQVFAEKHMTHVISQCFLKISKRPLKHTRVASNSNGNRKGNGLQPNNSHHRQHHKLVSLELGDQTGINAISTSMKGRLRLLSL